MSGAIEQARIARDIAGNKAPIHVNILWEMAAAEEILTRTLEKAGNIIDGVTRGAGMPYKLSEIAAKYGIYYYPIVFLPELLMLYGRDLIENFRLSWRSCL